jgi:hypothetical protein
VPKGKQAAQIKCDVSRAHECRNPERGGRSGNEKGRLGALLCRSEGRDYWIFAALRRPST